MLPGRVPPFQRPATHGCAAPYRTPLGFGTLPACRERAGLASRQSRDQNPAPHPCDARRRPSCAARGPTSWQSSPPSRRRRRRAAPWKVRGARARAPLGPAFGGKVTRAGTRPRPARSRRAARRRLQPPCLPFCCLGSYESFGPLAFAGAAHLPGVHSTSKITPLSAGPHTCVAARAAAAKRRARQARSDARAAGAARR